MVPARFLLNLGGLGGLEALRVRGRKNKYIQTQIYIYIYI